MGISGALQVFKLSTAESTYGETVANPSWAVIGVVEDGDIDAKADIQKYYGIGSADVQARAPGRVDNTVRCTLVAPTAAEMNKAITRTAGVLASYNVAAGVSNGTAGSTDAWRGVGLKWNSMSIELNDKDPLKVTLDGIFKSLVADVDASGHSYTIPHVWLRDGAVLTLDGGSAIDFLNVKIDVKNNLEGRGVDNTVTDHKRVISELAEGAFDIDVTMDVYDPIAINLEKDCPLADDITLVLTLNDLCDTAGTPTPMVITCTGGTYVSKRQPLAPNKYVEFAVGLNFTDITITGPAA